MYVLKTHIFLFVVSIYLSAWNDGITLRLEIQTNWKILPAKSGFYLYSVVFYPGLGGRTGIASGCSSRSALR